MNAQTTLPATLLAKASHVLQSYKSFSFHSDTSAHSVDIPNQAFSVASTLPGKPEELYGNAGLMPAIKVANLGKYIQTKKNETGAFKKEFTVNIFLMYKHDSALFE